MSRVNPIKETEKVMQNPVSEFKPERDAKSIKLTAVIVAVVVVALAGIGGGYAYWTHHEDNAYHEAVAQAENADKALSKAVDEATATTYKADQLKEPKLLDKLDAAISKAKALKGVPGSFKNNGDGTLSWETSGGPCTYLSPGVHGKQFDEYYSFDDVEDNTIGLPRIETNGPGGLFVKFMG